MKVQAVSGLNVKDVYLVPVDRSMDDESYSTNIWFRIYKGSSCWRCRCMSYEYPSNARFRSRISKEEWNLFAKELSRIERLSERRYIGLLVLVILSLIGIFVLHVRNPKDPALFLFVILIGIAVILYFVSIDRQEMLTCKGCHVFNRYLFHGKGVQARFQVLIVGTGSSDFYRYYIKFNLAALPTFEALGIQFTVYRMGVKGEEMDYLAWRILGIQLSRYPREKDLEVPTLEKKLLSLCSTATAAGDNSETGQRYRAMARVKASPTMPKNGTLPPLIFHKYAVVPDTSTAPPVSVALGASSKGSTRIQIVLPQNATPGTTLQVTHPITGLKHEFQAPPGSYPNMTLILDL